jgi:hypothetical protein
MSNVSQIGVCSPALLGYHCPERKGVCP